MPTTRYTLPSIDGKGKKGVQREAEYTINVKGVVDKEDVRITIDPAKPGSPFKGVGSNYRVHDLERDSSVIFYCMDSIRVAWGRIAFDWKEWQPNEKDNPLVNARAGKLSEGFYDQIEMARILAKLHIPMIMTIWSPPVWAIDSSRHSRQGLEHDAKGIRQIFCITRIGYQNIVRRYWCRYRKIKQNCDSGLD